MLMAVLLVHRDNFSPEVITAVSSSHTQSKVLQVQVFKPTKIRHQRFPAWEQTSGEVLLALQSRQK